MEHNDIPPDEFSRLMGGDLELFAQGICAAQSLVALAAQHGVAIPEHLLTREHEDGTPNTCTPAEFTNMAQAALGIAEAKAWKEAGIKKAQRAYLLLTNTPTEELSPVDLRALLESLNEVRDMMIRLGVLPHN